MVFGILFYRYTEYNKCRQRQGASFVCLQTECVRFQPDLELIVSIWHFFTTSGSTISRSLSFTQNVIWSCQVNLAIVEWNFLFFKGSLLLLLFAHFIYILSLVRSNSPCKYYLIYSHNISKR